MKQEKFINLCEYSLPVFIIPALKLVEMIGSKALNGVANMWLSVTLFSSLFSSNLFIISNNFNNEINNNNIKQVSLNRVSAFKGYLAHYTDTLFISKNKQIYNNVIKKVNFSNDESSDKVPFDDLKSAVLFTLMKILTACGIDSKDSWWAFCSLNGENMGQYSNFFMTEEFSVEKKICNKMKDMPNSLIQQIFDFCIEEIGEGMGARFYLIHQHHSFDFYSVMKKINLNFSNEDKATALDFVEMAKNDESNSNQYLSYGSLLNDDLIKTLVGQSDVPDEILDYLIFSNSNIELNKDLIYKISQIKNARKERQMLQGAVKEVVVFPLDLKTNKTNNGLASNMGVLWESNRMLELPVGSRVSTVFKV